MDVVLKCLEVNVGCSAYALQPPSVTMQSACGVSYRGGVMGCERQHARGPLLRGVGELTTYSSWLHFGPFQPRETS